MARKQHRHFGAIKAGFEAGRSLRELEAENQKPPTENQYAKAIIMSAILTACTSMTLEGQAATSWCGQALDLNGCILGLETDCNGTCTWTDGDPENCGACGYSCGEHGYHAYVCQDGECYCPPGWDCGPEGWVTHEP